MQDFYITGTLKSPEIDFKTSGKLRISGVSVLEDSYDFYRRPIQWVEEYVLQPADKTVVDLDLKFFNTSSQVNIFEILMRLADLQRSGYKVEFNWYYTEEDMRELGEDIANLLGIKFNFIKKESEPEI